MLNLEKERAKTFSEIGESVRFFFELPEYEKNFLFGRARRKPILKNLWKYCATL